MPETGPGASQDHEQGAIPEEPPDPSGWPGATLSRIARVLALTRIVDSFSCHEWALPRTHCVGRLRAAWRSVPHFAPAFQGLAAWEITWFCSVEMHRTWPDLATYYEMGRPANHRAGFFRSPTMPPARRCLRTDTSSAPRSSLSPGCWPAWCSRSPRTWTPGGWPSMLPITPTWPARSG